VLATNWRIEFSVKLERTFLVNAIMPWISKLHMP
jgi:hypothetical protein